MHKVYIVSALGLGDDESEYARCGVFGTRQAAEAAAENIRKDAAETGYTTDVIVEECDAE